MKSGHPESDEWGFPNRSTPLGSAPYYAVRFSPAQQRRRNALLFAWHQLIQGVAEHPRDSGAARLKLDWWRQELENLAGGKARHPLAIELQHAELGESAVTTMTAIIDSADEEIRAGSLADGDTFGHVCRSSLGNLFLLLAQIESSGAYPAAACLESGGYCAAVERIRHIADCPHRVPGSLEPQRLEQLDRKQKTERIDALLGGFQVSGMSIVRQVPDFAGRLTALSRAMHSKMRSQGYPVSQTPVDRAPIAHLWTAWRCR